MKKLIIILIGIFALFILVQADFFHYGIRFPVDVQTYINYSEWVWQDTTNFDADTTAFFMNAAGTGQIIIVNYDLLDTLGISFDDGVIWVKIPPVWGILALDPANYDSVHFRYFGFPTTGDTAGTPLTGWTIYESIH